MVNSNLKCGESLRRIWLLYFALLGLTTGARGQFALNPPVFSSPFSFQLQVEGVQNNLLYNIQYSPEPGGVPFTTVAKGDPGQTVFAFTSRNQDAGYFRAASGGPVTNAGIVSVALVLTNVPPGGPYFSSNYLSGTTPWQFFEVPVGTNLSGGGLTDDLHVNNPVFIKRNRVVSNDGNIGGVFPVYSFAGCTNNTYASTCNNETAGVSYLFNIVGDNFIIGLRGNRSFFKFYVNQVEDAAQWATPNDGVAYYYQVTFASGGSRQIELQLANNGILHGIYVNPTDTYVPYAPSKPLTKFLIIGDSRSEEPIPNYLDTNGNSGVGLGYGTRLGQILSGLDVWSLGSGGTGYIATNNGSRLNFQQRIQTDVLSITNETPYVLFAGGGNDTGLAGFDTNTFYQACTNTFGPLLTARPNTKIFAVEFTSGNQDNTNPNVINAGLMISNALAFYGQGSNYIDCITGPGGPWITGTWNVPGSGNAVIYTSADGTHPTPAGHSYLAQRLAFELALRGVR